MTQKLASRFADYREYHTNKMNQVTHYIGVPLIVISLFGMLARVTFGNVDFQSLMVRPDLGWALWIISITFYLYLDWKIALAFAFVLTGMYLIGRSLPMEILIPMHVIGWIIQYIGHLKYEKRSPAFYKNMAHLFIGPLWVFAKAIRYGEPA